MRTRFVEDANDLQANAFLHESGLWSEANWLGSRLQTGAREGGAYGLMLDLWIRRQAAFRYE